jgi:hypothetical protein
MILFAILWSFEAGNLTSNPPEFLGILIMSHLGFEESISTEAKAQPVEGFAGAGELFAMEVDTAAAMQRFQETVWGAQLGMIGRGR